MLNEVTFIYPLQHMNYATKRGDISFKKIRTMVMLSRQKIVHMFVQEECVSTFQIFSNYKTE